MVDKQNKLKLTHVTIKNFRCFTENQYEFDSDIVLIQGNNGSGKTSLLEALHYLCYLRSFRTHVPKTLIQLGSDNFFLKIQFNNTHHDYEVSHELAVGLSGKDRLVKLDQQTINSYKQLLAHYRIITLTSDDLAFIQGGPEERRTFLDQALLLEYPDYITMMRRYKVIVNSRNALLMNRIRDASTLNIWTERLFQASKEIQRYRISLLGYLEKIINTKLKDYFDDEISVTLSYKNKKIESDQTLDDLLADTHHAEQEISMGRSLFGAHLDDIIISFQSKNSRIYASRGQQKLIVILLKIALTEYLADKKLTPIFLIDDFMTDFDESRALTLLNILQMSKNQLIFTSPAKLGFFETELLAKQAQRIVLTP